MPEASDNIIPLMIEDPKEIKHAMADADCYIMNSDAEGFGLVLLESMLNNTPWISRDIAGAKLLKEYGRTYKTEEDLTMILAAFQSSKRLGTNRTRDFVLQNHLIKNTVDDILNILNNKNI
jgi:glycosyltransferase involved in cell wall biosynthesis